MHCASSLLNFMQLQNAIYAYHVRSCKLWWDCILQLKLKSLTALDINDVIKLIERERIYEQDIFKMLVFDTLSERLLISLN
jgi:hypothetical protein